MPRISNFPKTIEDCLTINIKDLKQWNYLDGVNKSGTINWSRNGIKQATIDIQVLNINYRTFVILNYKCNGEPVNYKIRITSLPSNLGKGDVKYFVCPSTGKHCRKLYLFSKYFLHREAFTGLMYQNQIESKSNRYLSKIFNKAFLPDEVYQERYKKYFKTHYNGKPTKKYLKLENIINISDSFPNGTLEALMLM